MSPFPSKLSPLKSEMDTCQHHGPCLRFLEKQGAHILGERGTLYACVDTGIVCRNRVCLKIGGMKPKYSSRRCGGYMSLSLNSLKGVVEGII